MGGALLMGRKTFDSIGRPLPGRLSLVVTRGNLITDSLDVMPVRDLDAFRPEDYAPREVWVAGGAEIYAQLLPRCDELFLSLLDHDAEGDTFFPAFEDAFELRGNRPAKTGFRGAPLRQCQPAPRRARIVLLC